MKRVILLALLALVLPTAALASSFDFPTGTFSSGSIHGSFTAGGMLTVSITGTTNTVGIMTGPLSPLPAFICPGSTCFTASTGTVTVGPGGSILSTPLESVIVTRTDGDVAIHGILEPTATVLSGSSAWDFNFSGTTIHRGEGGVQGQFTPVPEPGTLGLLELGLLGNGVIGLVGMARRRLKLGT